MVILFNLLQKSIFY